MTGKAFKFDEPGSRVLREWNEQRNAAKVVSIDRGPKFQRSLRTGQQKAMRTQGFAGAAIDRLTSSLAAWSGAINADLDSALVVLRARARNLAANNEFGKRFLTMLTSNVIGPKGPYLQVRARKDSKPDELDKIANDIIEGAWKKWCGQCDISGRMDFSQLQRVGLKGVGRDGEMIIRVIRGRNLPGGMQLQLLEADRLCEDMNQILPNGNMIRMGVEVTSYLKPVRYYLRISHPGESHMARAPQIEAVDARDIYHVFLPERAEQVRGHTWFHAIVRRMSMLGDYEEAAVVAAQVGAKKMGVFTRDEEHTAAGGAALDGIADEKGTDGELIMSAEAGEFMELPPGYALESWNPEYPHANFESFMTECKRGIAVGLDVAVHNLTGNMSGVNYSSARIAELDEQDLWLMLQEWWIGSFVQRIYREWLASALIRGEIKFPVSGKALPAEKFDKFADVSTFKGRRWAWVDPLKEVEAAGRKIELGLESRTNITDSQGRDFDDVLQEIAEETAAAKLAGVTLTNGSKPPPGPPKKEDE